VLLDPLEVRVDPDRRVIVGVYERTDEPYGNVWTDITGRHLEQIGLVVGDRLRVTVGPVVRTVPFVTTFGDVGQGRPLAYLNSDGRLALAINQGDLGCAWGLREGTEVMAQAIGEGDGDHSKHDDQTESSSGEK